jgi:uncharacterized protein YndB with AHSA1/START domain
VYADLDPSFEREMAASPVRVALEVDVAAPPGDVWDALLDVRRWPLWHRGIHVAILRGEEPAPGVRLDWHADGMRIRSTVLSLEPERRISWTLSSFGSRGGQRWSLEPRSDGGTRVRLEEWWTGLLPRILRRTLQRTLDVARAAWLEALADRGAGTSRASRGFPSEEP